MNITTADQLATLQGKTYVYAVIVMLVAFAISVLVAQLINFQPRDDRSYIKRRLWSTIICVVSAAGFWLYNQLEVLPNITKRALQDDFTSTNFICLGIIIGGYALLGIVVALVWRKSKFATIFFKTVKK